MVITLEPELEAALHELAARAGLSPEELAHKVLKDRFLAAADPHEPQDEWERRLRRVATDCGVSLSDSAVSSEGLYQ
jgi:hypothetical protein